MKRGIADDTSSVYLDDSNANIVYSSGWFRQGSGYSLPFPSNIIPDGDPNYNHTVHLTQTVSETVLLAFHGT